MEIASVITTFIKSAEKDPRLSPSHISVFIALVFQWERIGQMGSFKVFSYDIMPMAKLSSRSTYFKCIGDLNDAGYLKYQPSKYKHEASSIEFIGLAY